MLKCRGWAVLGLVGVMIPALAASQTPLGDPVLVIGSTDGSPEYAFTEVVSVQPGLNGGVVVADASLSEILWYDADGRFVRRCGGSGDGPGEYRRIGAMGWYGPDSLYVVDQFALRVTVLDASCEVGRTFRLDAPFADRSARFLSDLPHVIGALGDGRIVVEGPPSSPLDAARGETWATQPLFVLTAQGERAGSLGVFPARPLRVDEPGQAGRRRMALFSAPLPVAVGRDIVLVGDAREAVVRWIDPAGQMKGQVALSAGPTVTEDHVRAALSTASSGREGPASGEPYVPERFPALSALFAGDGGEAWVLSFPVPGAAQVELYGLDESGRRMGRYAAPSGLRPLAVRDGRLYGVVRDAFDVPYVHVYDLPGSGSASR